VGGTVAAPISGQSASGWTAITQSSSAAPTVDKNVETAITAPAIGPPLPTGAPLVNPDTASTYFVTNPWDNDPDGDGLDDGEEKLYGSDPNDPNSPGIYVEYTNDLLTGKYFTWEKHGNKLIGRTGAVVRRGATFFVGGPPDATLQIGKTYSGLTTLTAQRDWTMNRWRITVPISGTVGTYTLTLSKPGWSQTMTLYVIFDLPTSLTPDELAAYVYDDNPDQFRDEYGIWFMTTDDFDPVNWCGNGDPACHTSGGRGWAFQLDQYLQYVFQDHVMSVINGYTRMDTATNALTRHVDSILRIEPYSLRKNMYEALNAWDQTAQCSTHASVLTSLLRGAGIPARPVATDWDENIVGGILFDHSTEVYYSNSWLVTRAYSPPSEPITGSIAGGIILLIKNNIVPWLIGTIGTLLCFPLLGLVAIAVTVLSRSKSGD